ncbi:hypothetical protein [Pseudomonas fluorescens]|uniref:hypothetical protein n=1 Tax=Pseudomonas fluorescens TaxID=294 RepID=UPI00037D2D50|nr:hypothetical protein [Pseudomonas fluorescens]
MQRPNFKQRAESIRIATKLLANGQKSIADGRLDIHAALEGSDINSGVIVQIVLPHSSALTLNDLVLLERLVDALDSHPGGAFEYAITELDAQRKVLGY